jgi:trans-aconitate 2-methyltransferase
VTQWNPDLYLAFENERTQPSRDLIARIDLSHPKWIIDIGCGPGNSTRVLRERWPDATVHGLDSSPEMIEKARLAYPEKEWILADAASWQSERLYSLVFSSATLQWIPNHGKLIGTLMAGVESGGVLAVQVPSNAASPLHRAVLHVSQSGKWREDMAGCSDLLHYYEANYYYDLLSDLVERFAIWSTTYYHVMISHQGLIDWYSSTGMRPYLERLATDDLRRAFQSQVLDECRGDYPVREDGKILFPFRRLFFVAYKP